MILVMAAALAAVCAYVAGVGSGWALAARLDPHRRPVEMVELGPVPLDGGRWDGLL